MVSINSNQNNKITLTPADRVFVDFVQNRITMYGEIPYSLPEPMIIDIIKSSAKYFYKYYANAWERSYYYIKVQDILNVVGVSNFQTISVKVDPRIRIVDKVFESNSSGGRYSYDDGDIFATGTVAGSSANRPELTGINNNLYLLEHAVKMVEQRAYDNIFSAGFPFDFTQATHELILKRKPSTESIVLSVYKDIDIQALYNDSFFERHVLANAKKELKRKIGSHTIELPTGATINVDEICNNLEDAEKVEDLVKAASGVGDIIFKRK